MTDTTNTKDAWERFQSDLKALAGELKRNYGDADDEIVEICERLAVARDCRVALPEHQVAAPQLAGRRQFTERQFLHVAVARTGDTGGLQ